MASATSTPAKNSRLYLLGAMLALWCVAICGRLIYLQVFSYGKFVKQAGHQQQRAIPLAAKRGVIYDRAGRELAMSVMVDSAFAVPTEVRDLPTAIALIARITRATMLEVLSQDYIRTAHAKGLSSSKVLIGHALKNAAVPIATIIGIGVALLIGGVIVTETVFAIPGIGRLTVDAILRRDYPIIQGVILLFSAAYVIVNLLVDLSYTVLDPRVRY